MPGNLRLKPDDERRLDRLVASGRYASRDAAVHEAIDLVSRRDEWLGFVEARVVEGRAQIAAGRALELDEAFDRLAARYLA